MIRLAVWQVTGQDTDTLMDQRNLLKQTERGKFPNNQITLTRQRHGTERRATLCHDRTHAFFDRARYLWGQSVNKIKVSTSFVSFDWHVRHRFSNCIAAILQLSKVWSTAQLAQLVRALVCCDWDRDSNPGQTYTLQCLHITEEKVLHLSLCASAKG